MDYVLSLKTLSLLTTKAQLHFVIGVAIIVNRIKTKRHVILWVAIVLNAQITPIVPQIQIKICAATRLINVVQDAKLMRIVKIHWLQMTSVFVDAKVNVEVMNVDMWLIVQLIFMPVMQMSSVITAVMVNVLWEDSFNVHMFLSLNICAHLMMNVLIFGHIPSVVLMVHAFNLLSMNEEWIYLFHFDKS